MVRQPLPWRDRDNIAIKRYPVAPVTYPVNTELGMTDFPHGAEFYLNAWVQIIDDPVKKIDDFTLVAKFILRDDTFNYQMSSLPSIKSVSWVDVIFV